MAEQIKTLNILINNLNTMSSNSLDKFNNVQKINILKDDHENFFKKNILKDFYHKIIIFKGDDETFLKNILQEFYRKIIKTNDFNNFEVTSIEWIMYKLENNDKDPRKILEMMQDHIQSKFWFTSLIGFFYQSGIGCDPDRSRAMELYLLAINDEKDFQIENFSKLEKNKDSFDALRNKNIIIGKYLLALFYYRDIILDIEGFNYNQIRKETENNQNELIKLLKLAKNGNLEAQNNLAICYRNGDGIEINHEKAFKWFLSSAEKGNSDAQFNLAICYMDGMGIQKNQIKAYDWFLKSEQSESSINQNESDEMKEFKRNIKLAIANNPKSHNYLGHCYQNGKGVKKGI
jgi:hypothetical protein